MAPGTGPAQPDGSQPRPERVRGPDRQGRRHRRTLPPSDGEKLLSPKYGCFRNRKSSFLKSRAGACGTHGAVKGRMTLAKTTIDPTTRKIAATVLIGPLISLRIADRRAWCAGHVPVRSACSPLVVIPWLKSRRLGSKPEAAHPLAVFDCLQPGGPPSSGAGRSRLCRYIYRSCTRGSPCATDIRKQSVSG